VEEVAVKSGSRLCPHSKTTLRGVSIDEGWKYAILFAATVLSARTLTAMQSDKPDLPYARLAPQHQLAAVERLDAPTVASTATTTASGAPKQEQPQMAVTG
jgi:hypothetical protein